MSERERSKEALLEAVADSYSLTVEQLKGRARHIPMPEARAVLMYIGTRKLGLTMYEAAQCVNLDHSSAVTQGNKIEYRQEIYSDVRSHVDEIVEAISDGVSNPYFEMFANFGRNIR